MTPYAPVISTVGLMLDITGAVLVASDMVEPFKGRLLKPIGEMTPESDFEETTECSADKIKKYHRAKLGLTFLIIGFVLQIISSWVSFYA